MTLRRLRFVVLTGLGVLAGAVLPASARAQVPVKRDTLGGRRDTLPTRGDTLPSRGDTTRAPRLPLRNTPDTINIPLPAHADSMIRNDSAAQGILGRGEQRTEDTLKAPLARPESPPVIEIGASRVYDRSEIFATGALTLSDLLGRVPGLTRLATGWLLSPTAIASQGNLRGVRVFLDGIELDPLDQRDQGTAPVNDLVLSELEELRIERGADEVRVYARSWRVVSTTPYTRADVLTGDQSTNLYRGYFGRRYTHGEALQVSAEQFSQQPNGNFASSDGKSYMVRFGMARGPWSADVVGQRREVTRERFASPGSPTFNTDTISPFSTRRTLAYLRLANGDPDASRWAQVIASSNAFLGSPRAADTTVDIDSSAYENQYLFTGGLRRGAARVSVAERLRASAGRRWSTPSARASLETEPLSVSLFGEGSGPLQPSRLEATGRASLLGRVTLLGVASRTGGGIFDRVITGNGPGPVIHTDGSLTGVQPGPIGLIGNRSAPGYELAGGTNVRGEAGLKVRDLWLSAGLLRRGATTLLPPAGLDSVYAGAGAVRQEGAATATTAAIRGRLWRAVNIDAWAVAWSDSVGLYRPRYQTRTELYVQTNLLDRFPRGNFGLLASLAHEYRSNTRYAVGDSAVRTALGARTLDFKLEIRIQTAVISYQFRNMLQENYAQVPGLFMPRQTQFYGVRWDFWN